jgi:hypothetical protein
MPAQWILNLNSNVFIDTKKEQTMFGKLSKTALISLLITLFATAMGLSVTSAFAVEGCDPSHSSVITRAGEASSPVFAYNAVRAMEDSIRKIPFIGKPIVDGLFKELDNLPFKQSNHFGKYLEYNPTHKDTITIFNVGTYAGSPRLVVAYSHNDVLATDDLVDEIKPSDGALSFLPGIKLEYPVIFFRPATGAGSIATPQVNGSDLKNLPGKLGEVANKAAGTVTRTLRIPVGALMITGFTPTGAMKTKMELLNLPDKTVYLMAGSGYESWPPGGATLSQCNVDPLVSSYEDATSIGRADDKKRGREVRTTTKAKIKNPASLLPTFKGYVKISVPGKWMNPMTLFDPAAYTEDAVLMIEVDGSVASWGAIRNYFGKDYVYAIDMPGILDIEKAKSLQLPEIGFGLSTAEFSLADAVNLKIGMMTQFTNVETLRKLSVLAGATNTADGKWAQHLFNAPVGEINSLRAQLQKAIKDLPLDKIKITNPNFVDYDVKTSTYPPSSSFNVYFAAGNGITATGERGPVLVTNGDFEMFDQTLASAKVILSLQSGLTFDVTKQIDLHLGKVAGENINVSGEDKTLVEIKQEHIKMEKSWEIDIVSIAEGEAKLEFKLDNTGATMRVVFDPTGSCAPPIPIKIDTTIDMPGTISDLKKEIKDLIEGVDFDSSGFTKCGGKIIKWAEEGAEYVDKYANVGADYAEEYSQEGVKYAARYGEQGANEVKNFATNISAQVGDGVVKGGKAVFDVGKNLGNTISKFAKGLGCRTGIFSCKSRKIAQRPFIPSPFLCPSSSGKGLSYNVDYSYNVEFGRCWANQGSMYGFAGAKTTEKLCMQAAKSGGISPINLEPCSGKINQQFKIGTGKELSFKHHLSDTQNECATVHGKIAKGEQIVAGNCKSPTTPKFDLDDKGRLTTTVNNKKLCLRPKNDAVKPNIYGHMASWVQTPVHVRDIAVGTDNMVFGIGVNGGAWEFRRSSSWANLGGSNLERLDVGSRGEIWAVDKNGAIQHRIDGKWNTVPGAATDIGVGGGEGKTVVAIGRKVESKPHGFMIYKWDHDKNKWKSMQGHAIRVDVDGEGRAWVVQRDGSVWHSTPKEGWKELPAVPGGAADIGASSVGAVMVATLDNKIYTLENNSWKQFPGVARDISLDPLGSPWVSADIEKKGTVYAHKSAIALEGWKGVTQTNPFTAPAVNITGANLILDSCEESPVMNTWTKIQPEQHVASSQTGLHHSFRLVSLFGKYLDASYSGDPIGRIGVYGPEGQPAGQELSAVFVDEKRFALYSHETGYCYADNGKGNPAIYPCTFAGDQLWSTKRNKGRYNSYYSVKNDHTQHCMAFSNDPDLKPGTRFLIRECNPAHADNLSWYFYPVSKTVAGVSTHDRVIPWRAYGGVFGVPTYSQDGDIVTITGLIRGGNEYDPVWTIPKNLAPPVDLLFNSGFNATPLRMQAFTTGKIVVNGNMHVQKDVPVANRWVPLSFSYGLKNGKPLKLASGWQSFGGGLGSPVATKSGNRVVVNGVLKAPGGKYGPGQTHVATLPVGMRPPARLSFNVNNHVNSAQVDVLPNGDIYWIAGGHDHGWVSLDGIVFSTKPTGDLPLVNGWVAYAKGNALPTISRQGKMVTVSGLLKGGKWGELAMLPKGYRPPKTLVFYVNNSAKSSRVDVHPTGLIKWVAGGKDHGWISLSGITFETQEVATHPIPWKAYGGDFGSPTFSKEGDIVTVTGLIKGGNHYDPVWTMPKNMAPPKGLLFNSGYNATPLRMQLYPNGKIVANGNMQVQKDVPVANRWLPLSFTYGLKGGKPLTLASGWQSFGGGLGSPVATKSGNMVVVNGVLKAPGGKYGPKQTHVATLPVGMRPPGRLSFNVNNHDNSAEVDVMPNGDIYWIAGGHGHGWLSLDGIVFSTKPTRDLPLAKGWVAYAKGNALPTISRQGKMVTVSGLLSQKQKGGKWDELAMLPKGYRPPKRLVFYVNNYANSSRVDVFPTGEIKWVSGGKDHGWISLSGITFETHEAAP